MQNNQARDAFLAKRECWRNHLKGLHKALKVVHPGSRAEKRIKREVKEAEIMAGLWQGRAQLAHEEGAKQ